MMIYVGIDTGTHTGVAVYDSSIKAFTMIDTMLIHKAMDFVRNLHQECQAKSIPLCVYYEDAHLRSVKWLNTGREQGAGSIKRDCNIWRDFLKDESIEAYPTKPYATKQDAKSFAEETGWTKRTSNHGRDAANIILTHFHE